MAEIIDALKRLERIGSENSKTVEKVKQAADRLSKHLLSVVPEDAERLPRGYIVLNRSAERVLAIDGESPEVVSHSRHAALRFAEDVATGWLDDLADWLQAQATESESAVQALSQVSLRRVKR